MNLAAILCKWISRAGGERIRRWWLGRLRLLEHLGARVAVCRRGSFAGWPVLAWWPPRVVAPGPRPIVAKIRLFFAGLVLPGRGAHWWWRKKG